MNRVIDPGDAGNGPAGDVLAGLDSQQRAVATTFGMPVVVLAGAGTGKTRAITHRIAHGALCGRLRPEHTLAVTFTARAAGELRQRLHSLGVPRVQARTFHSAALRQLAYFWPRVHGGELPPVAPNNFALVAEAGQALGMTLTTSSIRELVAEVGWAKASQLSADRYAELAGPSGRGVPGLEAEQVARLLRRYEQVKKRRGLIDFDDILLCTIALLAEHPQIAEQVRDQYRYFTVDEFQDVSPVQRSLLELWLAERPDICVVGDPNQAIHTFAGAQPGYLTSFAADHPGAVLLKLETNYRSTPQIVRAANALLGRGLRLRAVRPAGAQIEIYPTDDDITEAEQLAGWLREQQRAGLGWSDLAVLYRINAQAEALQMALTRAGIPYLVRDPETSLGQRTAQPAGQESDRVTLATLHSSKGLEWEAVAIVGASEGLLPLTLATTAAAVAEERRLCYVGVTRARSRLRISWARNGSPGRGRREASRFLRGAGLIDTANPGGSGPLRRRRNQPGRRLPVCWVCRAPLSETDEIKLGRHLRCVVTMDEELLDRLKNWRSQRARLQSVPAFVVFTDATLQALAERRPTDTAGLAAIPGIGAVKLARYGGELLNILAG